MNLSRVRNSVLLGRWWLLTAWASGWLVAGLSWQRGGHLPRGDWWVFEFAARTALGRPHHDAGPGGLLHFYANNPAWQVGPPSVAVSIPSQLLPSWWGLVAMATLLTTAGLAAVRLLEVTARDLKIGDDSRRAAVVLLGGVVLIPAWSLIAAWWMHVDDALALLGLVVTVCLLLRAPHRWVWAAVALGVATAAKPWALVFVPLLMSLPRRHRATAGLVALATAAIWWLPFVLASSDTVFALGRLSLPVEGGSPLSLLGLAGDGSPPWVRPTQFLLGAAVTGVATMRGRLLAAPALALATRFAIDPQTYNYYAAGPLVAAFLLDLLGTRRRWPLWTIATAATYYGLQVLGGSAPVAALRLVLVVGLAVALWCSGDGRFQPAAAQPTACNEPTGSIVRSQR